MKKSKSEKNIGIDKWAIWVVVVMTTYAAVVSTMDLFRNEDGKLAYVNSAQILERYNGAIEANKVFEEETKKW